MSGILSWVASSGVVQGAIIGATLAFLTTVLVLDSVAKAETTTVNGWSSIRRAGQPGNGLLVRAALQKALPVVNVFEEAAYWTTSVDSAGKKLSGEHAYRLHFPPGHLPPNDAFWSLTATDTVAASGLRVRPLVAPPIVGLAASAMRRGNRMLKPQPLCFLIADISGYTKYLAGVELDHAQDILADLIGTIVTALRPTFRLAEIEGDAAFTVAPTEKLDGSLLLDTIERCYFGFRRRRRDVGQATSCACNACSRIPDLNLKFVVHQGIAVRQRIAGRVGLVGADVIIVHRLLKNSVVESADIAAYALFTQECIDAMGIDPEALGMRSHRETYEHVGEVPGWILDLEQRWQEEEQRRRVIVSAAEAAHANEAYTKAPPQMVWEFMTAPGRRMAWQYGVTDVIVEANGNRRGVGATTHCVHGQNAIIEEVLDWRPYDYVTDRATMNTPAGPVTFLTTVELEPTTDGTIIHTRLGFPMTAKERAIMAQLAPTLETYLTESERNLTAQLEAELAARMAGRTEEPELPGPRPAGLFSKVQPLLIVG